MLTQFKVGDRVRHIKKRWEGRVGPVLEGSIWVVWDEQYNEREYHYRRDELEKTEEKQYEIGSLWKSKIYSEIFEISKIDGDFFTLYHREKNFHNTQSVKNLLTYFEPIDAPDIDVVTKVEAVENKRKNTWPPISFINGYGSELLDRASKQLSDNVRLEFGTKAVESEEDDTGLKVFDVPDGKITAELINQHPQGTMFRKPHDKQHNDHYTKLGDYEPFKVYEAFIDGNEELFQDNPKLAGYYLNVIKYLARINSKDTPLKNMEKARVCLDKMIQILGENT